MTGPSALAAFERAAQLVKQGDFAAARAVALLPSDRQVIEQRIEAAIAKGNDETINGRPAAKRGVVVAKSETTREVCGTDTAAHQLSYFR